jgi:DNA-binding NarL/FixJ family response regulator
MKNAIAPTPIESAQRQLGNSTIGAGSPARVPKWEEGRANGQTRQATAIKVALVDCYCLSRDCIISAIHARGSDIKVVPFSSIRECIIYPERDLDVIVYYCHDDSSLEQQMGQEVTTLRQALTDLPIIVLSDVKQASQSRLARAVIRSGARGFIPTRTIEMPIVSAAIRYITEGGTVVPVEILFSDKSEYEEPPAQETTPAGLTSRQISVFAHLRQGKPNKIIAHDLRMSESTVKVHIRNIMRKMGATNRTQAVYKARQFYDGEESACT